MNSNDIKTYKLIITGKVQGVGFRYWFSNLAISHRLNGYIKNLKNVDEVEAIVQGKINDIRKILEKSKVGPELALVEDIIQNEIFNDLIYSGFVVKYDN